MSTEFVAQDPPPPVPPEVPPITTDDPASSKPEAPPPSDSKKPPDFVIVPSYSRWFSWTDIHECELRHMPEFFDGKSPSKTPSIYKYYRNSIVKKFRSTPPPRKITFTEVRRTIVGDVGSIRRVFDFLETWGLINYSPSGKQQQLKWEEKETKSSSIAPAAAAGRSGESPAVAVNGDRSKKSCSGCKAVCSIACFVCDKYDLVLCARCYVRGNYRVGVSSSEFRRVEISEPVKTDWTDKETLQLLEAVMHYGDDWARVAEHVGGRTEKECVARFIKLPFVKQFAEPTYPGEEDSTAHCIEDQANAESGIEPPKKRMHLSPLADASNPIMAQAAFLSALAGVEVSEAAARAAVATLYDMDHVTSRPSIQSEAETRREQELAVVSNGDSPLEEARQEAETLLKQEEDEFVKSISTITQVQMKEIVDKLIRYEEMELLMEKGWQQLNQMKQQLFLDQLAVLFHKVAAPKSAENTCTSGENVRTPLTSST